MNSYYIYGEDVPPDIDRSLLINIFKPFGKLQKIYINPEKTWFKVYFESLEVAEAALSVSGQPPHRMQLSIKKENFVGKKSAAAKAPSVTESDSTMSYDDEELYGSIGSEYYNIHGVPVQTLLDDNGMIYVPLQEVKQIGFELFDDRNIPRVNFNKQMLSEFKLYLNIKARKYISRMRCNIPDNTVEKIKNEIINEYANSSTASSNVNISRQIDNNMNQSQTSNLKSSSSTGSYNSQKNNNRNYSGGPNKSGAQPEVQKSLRRPVTNAINDSPQSSTFVGGGRGVGGVTRNPNSRNDNATNRTNINNSVLNVEKENLNPRTQTGAVPKIKTNVINDGSVIKRVELPLNKSVQVIVSFIESQNICWVVRESDRDKLEKLLFETNLEATKQSSITPVVGQICAATYRGSWYRAIVQEVTPEVKVQFIDFGNFNDEKVTEVRNLPPKITAEPVQAVKLHFTSSPQTKLVDNVELKIIASKKNKDGSYQVEEVSEKKPEQTNRKTLNATPAGKLITTKSDPKTAKTEHANGPTEKLDIVSAQSKSRSSTPISTANNLDEQKKLAERLGSLTLKEKLRNMPHPKKEVTTPNPDRKCVSDLFEINATGTIEFTERLADDTCLVFALVASFLNEVTYLEEIKPGNQTAMDFAGKIGDTIAVYKEDSETWVRGTIINIKDGKYVVALIDYGKIITVAKVCQLEKRFHSIPEFVCLVSGTKECIDFLQAEQTADFTCNELSNLTISFNDVFYNMNCRRWDPFTTSNLAGTTTESPVFTTPPPLKEVKDGERILLVSLSDGKLFVRNKDTHELLTRINCLITAYAAAPLAEAPVVNQLVLCPHESKTSLNRGVIKVVNAGYVDVDFIDLGFTDSVPLAS
ncbi:Tudor domain [Popillia japonica]|uniref:Tudor domain n=1 Tax=Popillia japonica TaxID=7064 RepID=A0AAW1IVN3_POPJA